MAGFKVAQMIRKSGKVADVKVIYTDRFSFDIVGTPQPADASATPALPANPPQPFSVVDPTTFGPASCTRWLHIGQTDADTWEPNFDKQQTIILTMAINDGGATTAPLTVKLLCQDHLSLFQAVSFAIAAVATFIVSLPVLLLNFLFRILGIRFEQKPLDLAPREEEPELLPAHGPNDVK